MEIYTSTHDSPPLIEFACSRVDAPFHKTSSRESQRLSPVDKFIFTYPRQSRTAGTKDSFVRN